MSPCIALRLGVQQRVFPAYRAPFFDMLADCCAGGMSVFSGEPMTGEALGQEGKLRVAQQVHARNLYIGWGAFLVVWQFGLIDWLERWQPEALIADTNPRNASTNAAIRWMHARSRPVIGWGLGAPPYPKRWIYRSLDLSRRKFLQQFDALISYSQTGLDQYAAAGFSRETMFIAPNAVTPRPSEPPPARTDRYPTGRPVVIFVGRLQARKRVDALLRACAALPATLQPRLIIVGEGPARAEFESQARGVYPSAEFVGDRRGADLDRLFSQADLFVLPGTGGLAVQQAMSFALPVMVAEADGTQSTLVRPENGWLLPPNDEGALCAALQSALADPAKLRQMGAESFRIVAQEVNLEAMVSVFAAAVDRVSKAVRKS